MEAYDQIIIGAGIAGLTAARELTGTGKTVLLLEKGRGPGGRVATRRFDFRKGQADHGAISFSIEEPELLSRWKNIFASLSIRDAPAELPAGQKTITTGINSLAKALAEGLDIKYQLSVIEAVQSNGSWTVTTDDGSRFKGKSLIVTSPIPQTAKLFSSDARLQTDMEELGSRIRYRPLWTLFVFSPEDQEIRTAFKGYKEFSNPIIQSVCQQSSKGIENSDGIYIVHSTEAFSRKHLEVGPEDIKILMSQALHDLGFDVSSASFTAHRWRYAFVDLALEREIWTSEKYRGLVLAGDFCLGSSISKAALSGLAAAKFLS